MSKIFLPSDNDVSVQVWFSMSDFLSFSMTFVQSSLSGLPKVFSAVSGSVVDLPKDR